MLYAEYYATPLVTVYRRRTLPAPGLVLRRPGERIASDHIVAEADVPQGYHLLDLERLMDMRIANVRQILALPIGSAVRQGDVLARTPGLFKRECHSPVDGKILDARRGKVLIQVQPRHVDLTAFYPGRIFSLVLDRGVVIETTGALVQGLWGTGREVRGRLECLASDPGADLPPDAVSPAHMGIILVCGRTLTLELIMQANENRVGALVVGSMPSQLVPAVEASGLPVIATEGLGDMPINARAFEVLQSYAGRETCFNPAVRTRWQVHRPEVLIPLPSEGQAPSAKPGAQLQVGSRVRGMRAPYAGQIGQVVALPPTPQGLASGLQAWGAEVDFESVGRVFVPLANLEIVR